ncbi:MAG: hypothetical protein WKF86_03025 [Acidimicrobiales bacterium]
MDLSGTWRAAPGREDLRRRFADSDFDDAGWIDIEVPGHWRSTPGLDGCDGPVLYRRTFEAASPVAGRRSFVVLEGCFYQSDVWLDGFYLGDTEGYFRPNAFEVTQQQKARDRHVLAVELTCTPQADKAVKRNLTGVFQDSDILDPDWNPGGIWRPVRLVETGPVRIAALRVSCPVASNERALLGLATRLDAAEAGELELRTTVEPGGVEHLRRAQVTAGANELSWQVEVESPSLWWPRALSPGGAAPALVDVKVEVSMRGGPRSDVASRRTGLRQVRMHRFVLEVNGERLFLKGAVQGPTRMALGEVPVAELERDMALAQDAGLDLLRLQAHISRPELYEAADRAGLLLWQDLPLRRGHARTVRAQALRQAKDAVDLLAHHPSIVIWCAQDEPARLESHPGGKAVRRYVRAQVLPVWNRALLDSALSRVLEKADGSRPVVPHSGRAPHPKGGTGPYSWLGWYHGDERDLPAWLRRLPALARFVGAFGAQAVPETAAWMGPEHWPNLDWDRLRRNHGLHKAVFDQRVPPDDFPTFEAWKVATQEHQATLLRHHVEELRRLKYRPTGGFCMSSLADSHPAVSWSVLDHERVPKPGFDALRTACAPVIVTADRLAATYVPGEHVALDVHVVSDLRHRLEGCTVRAGLVWSGGGHSWAFTGEVPADEVVRVGTLSIVVPEAPGPLVLDLRLEGSATASATYRSEILDAL